MYWLVGMVGGSQVRVLAWLLPYSCTLKDTRALTLNLPGSGHVCVHDGRPSHDAHRMQVWHVPEKRMQRGLVCTRVVQLGRPRSLRIQRSPTRVCVSLYPLLSHGSQRSPETRQAARSAPGRREHSRSGARQAGLAGGWDQSRTTRMTGPGLRDSGRREGRMRGRLDSGVCKPLQPL